MSMVKTTQPEVIPGNSINDF